MSDSNRTALAFQKETVWGVNPAPVVLKKLRFTKENLEHEKITTASDEIREDRQMPEKIEVGVGAKGGFDFEFSVGSFDPFLEAALMGTFADVGGVPTLSNGTTEHSFLVEKLITSASYMAYHGLMVDQLTLNFKSRDKVTGNVAFIGTKGTHATASINAAAAGAVPNYAAAATGLILSGSSNVGNLLEDGDPISSLKTLDITINNNLRVNDVIGKKEPDDIGVGSLALTGKVSAYFKNGDLLAKFLAHEYTSISLEVSREAEGAITGDHIGYRITLPKVVFDKGNPEIPGKDQDIMQALDFTAVADDGGTGKTIIIEKLLKAA